jgi:phage replication-related protein YjqB (UPF0714/DUF867 family)
MMGKKKDEYACFNDLAAAEIEGIDYRICVSNRTSHIAIFAPHGGWIESTTSQIAAAIAAAEFSLYCFEGLRPGRPHRDLHIKSEIFDEPKACRLVEDAEIAIGVHGRKDIGDQRTVWVGGLDFGLRDRIAKALMQNGFNAVVRNPGETLAGVDRNNICNRGSSKAGVQLEVPRTLRHQLANNASRLNNFADAVRAAISQYIADADSVSDQNAMG